MRRWVFPVEPTELVQLLHNHSSEKEGPFSWTATEADDRPVLYLDGPRRSGKDGFRCVVKAIRYLTSKGPLARGATHIITLHISKARGRNSAVMMKCRKLDKYGAACQHFAKEMDKLLAELTSSLLQVEQGAQRTVGADILQQDSQAEPAVDGSSTHVDVVEPIDTDLAPRVGHPGLDHDELIYRLAKAQEAEELKQANKHMTWRWIAQEIKWNKGRDNAGLALLRDARQRLHRLAPGDPLLAEIAAWRRAKKTKET